MKTLSLVKSAELFRKAEKILVGGVNSPARAFRAVEHTPIVISRADGPYIYDVDGNRYIDLLCSWGAQILGHNNKEIVSALHEQITNGLNYGLTSEKEIELAEIITRVFKSIEKIRFLNSGTEATSTAIRLARGYTGRKKIIMFEGCYHGHVDYLLTKAGSGLATYSLPKSHGIPEEITSYTVTLRYNDVNAVEEVFRRMGDEIAAVIVEPIAGNMGVVKSREEFLHILREKTEKSNSLLIFDEVITGFRVAYGGAQHLYRITPDLTCLGKIIGGGLPIGAVGGREEIMEKLAPTGPVYQAGTFSGNPLSMTAGIATLKQLDNTAYEKLEEKAGKLERNVLNILNEHGVYVKSNRAGSMMTFFFTRKDAVENHEDTQACDKKMYARFFKELINRGVLLPPSQFESMFLTLSHTEDIVEGIVEAVGEIVEKLVGGDE